MSAGSPPDLDRFVAAQRAVWPAPLEELRAGRKRGHWMWFVFPQIAGLGRSEMARFYALRDSDEARAYLAHPLLGPRLIEAFEALPTSPPPDAVALLGKIDALKLRSCATVFEAAGGGAVFAQALDRFFAGARCPLTIARLPPG